MYKCNCLPHVLALFLHFDSVSMLVHLTCCGSGLFSNIVHSQFFSLKYLDTCKISIAQLNRIWHSFQVDTTFNCVSTLFCGILFFPDHSIDMLLNNCILAQNNVGNPIMQRKQLIKPLINIHTSQVVLGEMNQLYQLAII